jgi:glycine/D-amino acid oxidase-like deaminating enzyme
MPERPYDAVILGAGLAGLATAYYLARRGGRRLAIVEKEAAPGAGATSKSAAMICRLEEDPLLARMTVRGADFFRRDFLSDLAGVPFRECGSLFVGRETDLAGLRSAETRFWSRAETVRRFPFLDGADFEAALHVPSDGYADAAALTAALARHLAARGVDLLLSRAAAARVLADGTFEVRAGEALLRSRAVVNAAGAWAGEVARAAGAADPGIVSKRRHIFVTEPLGWADPRWPIVWDVTHGVYFRPDEGRLWMSPCDEGLQGPGPAEVDGAIRAVLDAKIRKLLPRAAGAGLSRSWAGLRTFAPDGRFMIGWDERLRNFFWVACLGGHGVTVSASAGSLAAALISREAADPELEAAFSPARFRARSAARVAV